MGLTVDNPRPICREYKSLFDEFMVDSGVPQGSHCGTLLFNIAINDLAPVIYSENILFADDFKIYKTNHNSNDAIHLHKNLDAIEIWCLLDFLSFNVTKCNMIMFYRGELNHFHYNLSGHTLPRMSAVKDLGVSFHSHLTFNEHITYTVNKDARSLCFLHCSSREFSKPESLIALYCANVRSLMIYASETRSPYQGYQMKRLDTVHHTFLRMLSFKTNKPLHRFCHDYSRIAKTFKICSLT